MERAPDISLVLPCYNEEDVIERTVRELEQAFARGGHALELVCVDNGSTDRTGAILAELAAKGSPIVPVRVDVNQGYGNGLLAGIPAARGRWVGILCADGQVEADDVAKLFDLAARSKEPKLFKVRRRFRMDGLKRKLTSVAYNLAANVLFGGLGSIDVNGNPKLLPREALERMRLQSKDWFLDAEIMIKAKRMGLPVFERNVLGHMREGGTSNVRASTCLEFVRNLLRYRFGSAGKVERWTPELRAEASRR